MNYIKENISDMRASDILQLLCKLRMYMIFLDLNLLREIIDKFANEDMKQKLTCYEVDIHQFCMRTSIADFITCWDGDRELTIAQPLQKLKIKTGLNPDRHTLNDLEVLRKECSVKLRLVECALIFLKVGQGCVCITWGIHSDLITDVTETILQQDFITDMDIMMISVNDEVLYPQSDTNSGIVHADSSSSTSLIVPAPPLEEHMNFGFVLTDSSSSTSLIVPAPPLMEKQISKFHMTAHLI